MMQQQDHATGISQRQVVRVLATVAGGLLIVLLLFVLLNLGAGSVEAGVGAASVEAMPSSAHAATPDTTPDTAAADCVTDSIVPASECLALVQLYTQTNGAGWLTKTNWLQFGANAPCGWYGVVCGGDGNELHVRRLLLAGNQLSGTLPLELGTLPELRRLRLEKNALQGRIPPTICNLTKLETLSLAYNALFTFRASVEECLAPLESDWAATQTAPVKNLRVTEILTDSLRLEWTPISYTEDGGYYEIALSTAVLGPYTPHGITADKLSVSYVITGLQPGTPYFVRVRSFTPPHDDQPSYVRSQFAQVSAATLALSGRVLVAAYFPADNNLSTEIPYVLARIRRGTAHNPNVQVIMLVDGSEDDDTRVVEIANGMVFTTTVVMDEWGMEELDTADPAVLAWFLQYARDAFPSEREVAAIIGHGIALAPEVEWPESVTAAAKSAPANSPANGQIPPLPKEHDYSPSDVTNRGYMSAIDVGEALMVATDNGADPFDLLFFDQCFQGNLDVLYEVRNSAYVYVASPNYAWLVAAYDRYLTRFVPAATPGQMAQAIINNYESLLNRQHPNAIFWVRNSDLLAIAGQVNVLADALLAATQANDDEKIGRAVQQSQYVDTTQCGRQNLHLGPPDELIGIESFGSALLAEFGASDPYGVANALAALQPLVEEIAKHSIAGNPYIAPDELWEYANSLTILAPLRRDVRPEVAWRASIYQANTPFSATWTVDPSQPISVTKSLAYVRDGRWDEFLAAWYTDLTPTVGQWCHYIPPVQVTMTETEMLSLTVSAITTDSLQLAWTPTDDTTATEYWLYAQDPYAIGLQAERAVPLDQQSLTFSGLDAGSYRYLVVARNAEQDAIAQSNEVSVTLTGGVTVPVQIDLRLPLVVHDEETR